MDFKILQKAPKSHHLYIVDDASTVTQIPELNEQEQAFAGKSLSR